MDKTPQEIWEELSGGMRHELLIALEREHSWPYPRDGRRSRGLERRGLVTLTNHPMGVVEQVATPLGRAVAEYGRKAGV